MEKDIPAKKEAVIRRKEYIRQKMEEARNVREGLGPDAALQAPEPHLHPSFDSLETILHRYRHIESQSGWIMYPQIAHPRKILDHDDGVDGLIIERSLMP